MEFQEFKAIANGSSVFFLIALTLLLENGSSAVSESEETELKSVLAKGLHNFFSDEALGEVVCLAKSLAGIAPSELVDYIQQCDPIVHHVEDTMPDVCPICFGELTCENSVISGSDIVRCWKCTDCGSTGEAVYHARFSLHRNLKVRDGKAIYPWQLKERPEHDTQAGKY